MSIAFNRAWISRYFKVLQWAIKSVQCTFINFRQRGKWDIRGIERYRYRKSEDKGGGESKNLQKESTGFMGLKLCNLHCPSV